jgi:hypothetical protein
VVKYGAGDGEGEYSILTRSVYFPYLMIKKKKSHKHSVFKTLCSLQSRLKDSLSLEKVLFMGSKNSC